jgi:hypothetical protein
MKVEVNRTHIAKADSVLATSGFATSNILPASGAKVAITTVTSGVSAAADAVAVPSSDSRDSILPVLQYPLVDPRFQSGDSRDAVFNIARGISQRLESTPENCTTHKPDVTNHDSCRVGGI